MFLLVCVCVRAGDKCMTWCKGVAVSRWLMLKRSSWCVDVEKPCIHHPQDFAADPDEVRLRTGAHLMVSSLAGSLALVTCKEPLRLSIANQLRALLTQTLPPDQQLLENAVQQLTSMVVHGCVVPGCVKLVYSIL